MRAPLSGTAQRRDGEGPQWLDGVRAASSPSARRTSRFSSTRADWDDYLAHRPSRTQVPSLIGVRPGHDGADGLRGLWHSAGMSGSRADVAVIGGTGFYSFLESAGEAVEELVLETPYGAPSAPVKVGGVAGRRVAFLPRHGRNHELPPHRINYRANLWALRSLGVRQVIGPCAVGGLRAEVAPGDIVVPDQLVDRTQGRAQTYVETGAVHLPFADPYCPRISLAVAEVEPSVRVGGTMVVVEGPRFSTRAESRYYGEQGWTLVNMTGHPEAALARELRMCYGAIALVTDMDAGAESGAAVSQEEVFELFRANLDRLAGLLTRTIARLPDPGGCTCSSWADGIELGYDVPGQVLG